MTNADLGTLVANATALSSENLTKLIVKLTQGILVMQQVIPVVESLDTFIWHVESDTTEYNLPAEIGEKAEAEDNAIEYTKMTGNVKDYREKMEFSEKELRNGNIYNFIDPVSRAAVTIAQRLALAVENDAVVELTNTTKYPTINTGNATTVWTTTASSVPINDIEELKYLIRADMQMDADTIILGAEDYKNLLLSEQIRDANQYTRDVVGDITIEKICGLRILKSDVVYNVAGTLTPILSGRAIVMVSNLPAQIRESVPITAGRKWDEDLQTLRIYAKRSFKTILRVPKMIGILSNLKA
jgi:hypothetical protein